MAEHFGINALHLMLSGLGLISKEDNTLFLKKINKNFLENCVHNHTH